MNGIKIKIFILSLLLPLCYGWAQEPFVVTVNGKIDADKVGFALPHEHIMSNFGADPELVGHYDENALMEQVVPYLKKLRSMGVASIVEGTAAYFGRNVKLLKRISEETGIQIITNTGFYAAANDRYVPAFAYGSTAEEIADLWVTEFVEGIDDTEIRPGFIKLAFDGDKPSEIDVKLFEAGIITHKKTGLTLAVHTGNNPEAVRKQLDLLKRYDVSPNAWVWIHANKAENNDLLLEAASLGAWISLDGVNEANIDEYLQRISLFRANNLLDRLLLSHDGNSFPSGGEIREYQAVPEILVPRLKELGYSVKEIDGLIRKNPQHAFSIKKK